MVDNLVEVDMEHQEDQVNQVNQEVQEEAINRFQNMQKQQKEELKKAAELTDEWLAKANAKAKAKEQAKERAAGGGQATTVNPLQDDASDDESGN